MWATSGPRPHLNWQGSYGAYVRALVIAVLLLLPSTLEAQDTVWITPVEPSPEVAVAWNNVVLCAGAAYVPTQRYEDIKWFARDSVFDSHGDLYLGEWVAPDSIFITKGFEASGWVIAHEMLHHALNGPPTGNPHPLTPFMFPCKLLEFQQHKGGMNGGEPIENSTWPFMEVRRERIREEVAESVQR